MKTKLRTGIIGVGAVVREIYQYLYFRSHWSELLDIQAAADPNREYLNWFCDLAGIPPERRFADYRAMLAKVELDAVQVNTPDHLHAAPTIAALEKGLDVIVPKPTAATVKDTHAMIVAARKSGRFLGIDFHKREDPRFKEAEARYQNGRYGTLQVAVFYMLDKLVVADPNHTPRFFASPDFAEKNSPVSFLTVHMVDALMKVVNLIPARVRATGYSQKLPSLAPIAVRGYDLVDTEVVFQSGAVAHVVTGWALPNSAHALTVQSGRLICTNGMIDLGLDQPGLREVHPDGIFEVNPLFRNFEKDNTVTGYGIGSPGRLYEQALAMRNGKLPEPQRAAAFTPMALGFYTTLVLEGAEQSLASGEKNASGVTSGPPVDLKKLVADQLGDAAVKEYGL